MIFLAAANALGLQGHGRVSQWEAAKDEIADMKPAYLAMLRGIMARFRGETELSVTLINHRLKKAENTIRVGKLAAA